MENKNRFDENDFKKLHELKNTNKYSISLSQLKSNFGIDRFLYGIGIPLDRKCIEKAISCFYKVDFILAVEETGFCKLVSGNLATEYL